MGIIKIDNDEQSNASKVQAIMVDITPGTWWLRKGGTERVRLLSDIKLHEDEVHTVVLSIPPNEESNLKMQFLRKEFIHLYEQVSEEKALAMREAEIKALQAEIEVVTGRLSDQKFLESAAIEKVRQKADGVLESKAAQNKEPTTLPAAQQKNEVHIAGLNMKALVSTELSTVIQEQSQIIARKTAIISEFVQERASVALSKTKLISKSVDKINTAVDTLRIYSGNDVSVRSIRTDGVPADESHKVHLMQRKLYMDEESLIHAALGGADFNDIERFFELLCHDKSVLNRVAPHPKCIVAIQIRRNPKSYAELSIFESEEMNKRNANAFLLVRNGENLSAIFSPVQHFENLFPAKSEMNLYFREWDNRVTLDSTEFVDCLERLEGALERYKRIHLLICGAYERQPELLSPLKNEHGMALNLFDYQTSNDVFEFVYDVQNAIESRAYPPVSEWLKERSKIQVGSRVLFYPGEWTQDGYINFTGGLGRSAERAPAIVSYRGHEPRHIADFDGNHKDWSKPFIVQSSGDKLFIQVPAKRQDADWNDVFFKARIYLDSNALEGAYTQSFFVVDGILPEEIEHYFNSRSVRKDYFDYINMMKEAHQFTKELELELKPTMDVLHDTLDLTDLELEYNTLWLAVSAWMTENKGSMPPPTGSKSFASFIEWVANFLFESSNPLTDEILSYAKDNEYTPILVKQHSSHWELVREMTLAELDTVAPYHSNLVATHKVKRTKKGLDYAKPNFVLPRKLQARGIERWSNESLFRFWNKSFSYGWKMIYPGTDENPLFLNDNVESKKLYPGRTFVADKTYQSLQALQENIAKGWRMLASGEPLIPDDDTLQEKMVMAWSDRFWQTQKTYLTDFNVVIPFARAGKDNEVLSLTVPEPLFLAWQLNAKNTALLVSEMNDLARPGHPMRVKLKQFKKAKSKIKSLEDFLKVMKELDVDMFNTLVPGRVIELNKPKTRLLTDNVYTTSGEFGYKTDPLSDDVQAIVNTLFA